MTPVLLGSGVLLDWSGFDPSLGTAQPEGTLLFLRLAFALVPASAFVIAAIAESVLRYDLSMLANRIDKIFLYSMGDIEQGAPGTYRSK